LLFAECFLLTLPTLQPARVIAFFAAASFFPTTFGTWQTEAEPPPPPVPPPPLPAPPMGATSAGPPQVGSMPPVASRRGAADPLAGTMYRSVPRSKTIDFPSGDQAGSPSAVPCVRSPSDCPVAGLNSSMVVFLNIAEPAAPT